MRPWPDNRPPALACTLLTGTFLTGTFLTGTFLACSMAVASQASATTTSDTESDEQQDYRQYFTPLPSLPPIPADNSLTAEKVALGKMLFFEPRLSKSSNISCASCHNPALAWADRLPTAVGHDGQVGERNSPTVLNSGFLGSQFWDGREPDLEGQALGPIQNSIEMAHDLDGALARLSAVDGYSELFQTAFPADEAPLSSGNLADAIASFERTLNTPNAPLDRYLLGDEQALTDQQKAGMKDFVDVGCISCHRGANFSDSLFHPIQVPGSDDPGRFAVTNEESDRQAFRTASLRNVALTYPYFHDGSAETLEDVVPIMAEQMLKRELDEATVERLVSFLHALTGEQPVVTVPALP